MIRAPTRAELRTLVMALVHDGVQVETLSPTARAELRAALNVIYSLIGEDDDGDGQAEGRSTV